MSDYTLAAANAVRIELKKQLLEECMTDARITYDHEEFADDYANWLIDTGWVTGEPS